MTNTKDADMSIPNEVNQLNETLTNHIQKFKKFKKCLTFVVWGLASITAINLAIYGIAYKTFNTRLAEISKSIATLEEAQQAYKLEEIQVAEPEATEVVEITDTVPVRNFNYDSITQASNFTADEFDRIISDTLQSLGKTDSKLYGLGDALYQIEQEYNVNGLYVLGIATFESGWNSSSSLARNHNNLYGLMGKSFESTYDCTLYLGKLLRESYINKGLPNLISIGTKYDPNNDIWGYKVQYCADYYINIAKYLYGNSK